MNPKLPISSSPVPVKDVEQLAAAPHRDRVQMITMIAAALIAIMATIDTWQGNRAARQAFEAKLRVEQVREDLQIKEGIENKRFNTLVSNQEDLAIVTKDTHILVNSNMGEQLRLGMELSQFKALTTKLPEHIRDAKVAKEKYEEHVRKQAVVDRATDKK